MIEDLGERTEAATPRRRQEAREQGLVARSHDLGGAVVLLIATLLIWGLAMWMLGQGRLLIMSGLAHAGGVNLDTDGAGAMLRLMSAAALRIALPVLAIVWLAAFASQFVQIGWLFAPKAAAPDLGRLSPIKGLSRVFGFANTVKSSLDVLKVSLVLAIAAISLTGCSSRIAALPYMSALQALREGGLIVLNLALRIAAALLMLGILDCMYQRWRLGRNLRMTRQQIKDELKQAEGDPETRRRRIHAQQPSGLHRLPASVSKADVVLVDDERIAIALAFDESTMAAPKVVGKGVSKRAQRIRALAMQHNIPIIERQSLARALYKRADIDREIQTEHYKDMAEVLACACRLRRGAA